MSLLYSTQLEPGWQAPEFELPDTNGQIFKLNSQTPKRGILVVFTCNHCPYAKTAWPLLIDLAGKYQKRGIQFVAINSNDDSAYPEDSFEVMRQRANQWGLPFPYLRDENQEAAKAYQAQCTPDIFLFDKDKKLYYHGRINDNWKESTKVTRHDLDDALNRLFIGDRPPVEQFPSMGCSIKWK